ncbi:MAG: DUF4358 domain-containing protein [Oscillospiraceae bacterium]|nr:DUF4358 domain-containing protein [Oscillospiraceae bacterium]
MWNKALPLAVIMLTACMAGNSISPDEAARIVCERAYDVEMVPVTDEYILDTYYGIDSSMDAAVYCCPSAAVMSEVIIIRSDDPYTAREALDRRRTKAIERDALYPDDKRRAEESITGVTGDLAYFLMGEDADKAEEELIGAVNG